VWQQKKKESQHKIFNNGAFIENFSKEEEQEEEEECRNENRERLTRREDEGTVRYGTAGGYF
jgi:hypothetical protein